MRFVHFSHGIYSYCQYSEQFINMRRSMIGTACLFQIGPFGRTGLPELSPLCEPLPHHTRELYIGARLGYGSGSQTIKPQLI